MANVDRCPECGASYALVGLRHRCGSVVRTGEAKVREIVPVVGPATLDVRLGSDHDGAHQAGVGSEWSGTSEASSTYRYRDPEKRRAQMAVYMKGYRARKRK
jgi:hypothetical protein